METVWVVAISLLIVAGIIGLGAYLRVRSDLRVTLRDRDYYQKRAYENEDKVIAAERVKQELRQVLAASILGNHNNYLAIDPDTFDALPEDFAIFKSADTGSDGDHNILVYQVGPREVGGVKLQNAVL